MANYKSEFPDYYNESLDEALGTLAYPPGLANLTFQPQEYFSESANAYRVPMMTSNSRTISTMSQTSDDSGYDSGFCSPINSAPQFLHSPTSIHYFEDHNIASRVYPAPRGGVPAPIPSHSQGRPTNSSKKAQKATSSSPTSTLPKFKPYCCMFPGCEATFARPYDLGRHQKTRHTYTKRYDCPEDTCRRYGIPESRSEKGGFTRLDHFRDHVKHLHNKTVIKDKDKDGGQHWVLDPNDMDRRLWMRDETGNIRTKDLLGHIWVKNVKTGQWQRIS